MNNIQKHIKHRKVQFEKESKKSRLFVTMLLTKGTFLKAIFITHAYHPSSGSATNVTSLLETTFLALSDFLRQVLTDVSTHLY